MIESKEREKDNIERLFCICIVYSWWRYDCALVLFVFVLRAIMVMPCTSNHVQYLVAKIDGICIYYTYFSRIRITYQIWTFSVLLIFFISLFGWSIFLSLSLHFCLYLTLVHSNAYVLLHSSTISDSNDALFTNSLVSGVQFFLWSISYFFCFTFYRQLNPVWFAP